MESIGRILSSDVATLAVPDVILISVAFIAFMMTVLLYFAVGMLRYQHSQNALSDSNDPPPLERERQTLSTEEYRTSTLINVTPESIPTGPTNMWDDD